MCGIFSLLNAALTNDALYEKGIYRAFEEGKYRGPEFSVLTYIYENTLFGFHRLAINGLNSESNQPLYNKEKTLVLICNGEIYNYKELISEFKIPVTTDSDCEVIMYLYEKVGIKQCLRLLDGVFAFTLVDIRDKEKPLLFVARDPLGVRPLFEGYSDRNNNRDNNDNNDSNDSNDHNVGENNSDDNIDIVCYSSEIKMMISLNENLTKKLKIRPVLPGTYKIYQYDRTFSKHKKWREVEQERYFSICLSSPNINNFFHKENRKEYIERSRQLIRETLTESVRKRVLTTDRPIACLLSGGLDSSLITSIVNKCYKERADYDTLPQIETYSIGLKGSEDVKYAEKVAKFLGTKHTSIEMTEKEFLESIPEVIYHIESYDTTTVRASVGNYLVAKYIRQHSDAKVIFNGDGADELCGGYLYMHYASNSKVFDGECRRLLEDIHYFDVLRSDRCISDNGLEPRTPFLDKRFIQAYLSIDDTLRYQGIQSGLGKQDSYSDLISFQRPCEKWLLRSSFDPSSALSYGSASASVSSSNTYTYLPDEVLWRTKEAFSDGVSSQKRSWFTIIKEYIENHTSKICVRQMPYDERDGYIDMLSLKEMFQKTILSNGQYENKNLESIEIDRHLYPRTLEQYFYRKVFEYHFGKENVKVIPYFWMPRFVDADDCSARSLQIYQETI